MLDPVGFFCFSPLALKGLESKTDAQLKNDVMEELCWEPTVTSSDINVAANDGVVTLSSSVPYYAKKRLRNGRHNAWQASR